MISIRLNLELNRMSIRKNKKTVICGSYIKILKMRNQEKRYKNKKRWVLKGNNGENKKR